MSIPPEDGFREALEKLREIERQNKLRDHNQSTAQDGGENGVLANGRIATGAGTSIASANNDAKKAEDDHKKTIERLGEEALRQLESRMTWLREERRKVDEGLSAIERLQKRKREGIFNNSDQDKKDLALLGMTTDQFLGENGDTLLQQKKNDFEARKAWIDQKLKEGRDIKDQHPEKFEAFMNETDPAVSYKMWRSSSDEQMKNIGENKFNKVHDEADLSVFSLDAYETSSVAASLDDPIPVIENQNKDIPINKHFTASADPVISGPDSALKNHKHLIQDFTHS